MVTVPQMLSRQVVSQQQHLRQKLLQKLWPDLQQKAGRIAV